MRRPGSLRIVMAWLCLCCATPSLADETCEPLRLDEQVFPLFHAKPPEDGAESAEQCLVAGAGDQIRFCVTREASWVSSTYEGGPGPIQHEQANRAEARWFERDMTYVRSINLRPWILAGHEFPTTVSLRRREHFWDDDEYVAILTTAGLIDDCIYTAVSIHRLEQSPGDTSEEFVDALTPAIMIHLSNLVGLETLLPVTLSPAHDAMATAANPDAAVSDAAHVLHAGLLAMLSDEVGVTYSWLNRVSGNGGTVTGLATREGTDGTVCRELVFQRTFRQGERVDDEPRHAEPCLSDGGSLPAGLL